MSVVRIDHRHAVSGDQIKRNEAAMKEFFSRVRDVHAEQAKVAVEAHEALARLVGVMRGKTGQSYRVRQMLYSLWNDNPCANLNDVLTLDWRVRKDVVAVVLGFGYEPTDREKGLGSRPFFYGVIEDHMRPAGLFEWFIEAGKKQEVAS